MPAALGRRPLQESVWRSPHSRIRLTGTRNPGEGPCKEPMRPSAYFPPNGSTPLPLSPVPGGGVLVVPVGCPNGSTPLPFLRRAESFLIAISHAAFQLGAG